MSAELSGLAANRVEKQRIAAEIDSWSANAGMTVISDVAAGPKRLSVERVQSLLDERTTCGSLALRNSPPTDYALYEAITIAGDLANTDDVLAIKALLEPEIGDRSLRFETTILNEDLCAIRAALPKAVTGNVSISLSNGKTGQPALTGVFRTGDNPVVDVLLPGTITQGSLWVMVVDNTGKVFPRPAQYQPDRT